MAGFAACALAATTNDAELAVAYAKLPPADVSRDVMQAALPPRRPSWCPTVVLADRVAPAAAAAARTDARYAAASA